MFGRRRRERDEFRAMHMKIAAIHGDLLRRDEAMLDALADLAEVTRDVGVRLDEDTRIAGALERLMGERETAAIDLTGEPRVLGGSVAPRRISSGDRPG